MRIHDKSGGLEDNMRGRSPEKSRLLFFLRGIRDF